MKELLQKWEEYKKEVIYNNKKFELSDRLSFEGFMEWLKEKVQLFTCKKGEVTVCDKCWLAVDDPELNNEKSSD